MKKPQYRIHNRQGAHLMTVTAKNEAAAIRQAKKTYAVAHGDKLVASKIEESEYRDSVEG